jgi:SAM-dependent methyltransferase
MGLSQDDHAAPGAADGEAGPRLSTRLASFADYLHYRAEQGAELDRRFAVERALSRPFDRFAVRAYCYPCDAPRRFVVTYDYAYEVMGFRMPNWREHLTCETCGLNNRMRAALHLFESLLAPRRDDAILLTEVETALEAWLGARYPRLQGHDALAGAPPGGEALTAAALPAGSVDVVLSFEVLEHVADPLALLAECHRVLKRPGAMLLSVPFNPDQASNTRRARLREDGSCEHLLAPEYHGDARRPAGHLTFHQFGWELLDQLRRAGFDDAAAELYWSRELGYLGLNQVLFTATKARAAASPQGPPVEPTAGA